MPSSPPPARPDRPSPARRQWLLRRLGFSLGVGLLLLLSLEGGLRLLGWPTNQVRSIARLFNDDPGSFAGAVGMFRPGTRGRVAWPRELAYDVHINALGLRGPEVARAPAGDPRILVLGDSGTFGFYVGEEETLPARLQELLRRAGIPAEVLNGGCGGWSIDSETQFLEERAVALQPDLVLVVYCSNDIDDLRGPGTSYEQQKRRQGQPVGWFQQALEASAVHELAWRVESVVRGRRPRPLSSGDLPPAERELFWARYRGWLTRLRAFTALRGIPLVLHYQPDAWKLREGLPASDEERLRAECERLGVELISPLAAFQGRPVEETFLLPLDPHPSALGYRLQAQAIADHLLAHGETLALIR